METKRIAVLFTGGTIGSSEQEEHIAVGATAKKSLISHFEEHSPRAGEVTFTEYEPFRILSENMTPDYWEQLIAAVWSLDEHAFDGIIITHGTDTLGYTAALLARVLDGLSIPTVLVSAGAVLTSPTSNGHANFRDAVDLICTYHGGGVFVPFRTVSGECQIFRGEDLMQCSVYTDEFFSFNGKLAGTIEGGCFVGEERENRPVQQSLIGRSISLRARVLCLQSYPGMDYHTVNLTDVDVVLHGLYHSSTACTEAGRYSLNAFLLRCAEWHIPVYGAPCLRKPIERDYETTVTLKKSGMILLRNCSWETAYAYVLLAHSLFESTEDRMHFLQPYLS